jgi:tRNA-binding EMAP/Myf-like protein
MEKKAKRVNLPPPPKAEVNVSVLDIRVGTITKCKEHPDADKLWARPATATRPLTVCLYFTSVSARYPRHVYDRLAKELFI